LGAGGSVAGAIARGEIRLHRFPSPDKQRPVLVLTRESALRYLSWVTVAPVTSTIRGIPSEVRLTEADGMKGPCAVNLHNLVTVPKDHLGRRVTVLCPERMSEICAALAFALGCVHDLPAVLPIEAQTQ
jgi:mRNA interferase MazF